jgi:hypothetical protein
MVDGPITYTKGYEYFHTDLRPRSSISKYNLVLANSVGLIDREYKQQVLCRFKYIWQPEDMWWGGKLTTHDGQEFNRKTIFAKPNLDRIYKKGDKIAQLVTTQTHDIDFEIVPELPGEDRGGGFGSTDVKKNGGVECDVKIGPCACGAWHKTDKEKVKLYHT